MPSDSDADPTPVLDDRLPDAGVDSRWWYWIAAVPVYAAVSTLLGVAAFVLAALGMVADDGVVLLPLLVLFVLLVALPGLLLLVLFPIAVYVDVRAVAEADLGWDPDPALYGLLAAASVLLTGFTVGVLLALYYLYRRHQHVGVP